MKLYVASFKNSTNTWNAQVKETGFRSYQIDHEFNKPARATIKIADPTGAKLRKYNIDDDDVYLGIARVEIEDPDATTVFYGRILRAVGDGGSKTLTLECEDYMSQLGDNLITYDMREKLGTTDLRQSIARSDRDGAFVGPAQNNAGTYYFYDDGADYSGGMAFANDQYNGGAGAHYLMLTGGMAGTNTWRFAPYDKTVTEPVDGIDADNDAPERVWVDDAVTDSCNDNDGPYTVDYTFRAYLGHNTPSDFYVHDSIKRASIDITYLISGTNATFDLEIYDNNPAVVDYVTVREGLDTPTTVTAETGIPIPIQLLPYIVDANGLIKVRLSIGCDGVNIVTTGIDYLWVELECETTGYSTAVTINDTINPNKLEIATDLTAAATRVWEWIPYCIAKKICTHINGLVTTYDTQFTLTTSVESTTGISTRQYVDKSVLEILEDLAQQDNAVFWTPLGTTEVTWKKTFGADTAQITDADVDYWTSAWDYKTMFNTAKVYGARIGDYEIAQTANDAASVAKYGDASHYKTKVIRNSGVVSDTDAASIASVLSARDADPLQIIQAKLSGFDTTYRLGTITEITSSDLWSTAAKDYVVIRWSYDSAQHKSTITLHPKSSVGYMEVNFSDSQTERTRRTANMMARDRYVGENVTDEVP
jgi:hypothetical protein